MEGVVKVEDHETLLKNVVFHLRAEKDPRNLVLFFGVYSNLIHALDESLIKAHHEDIYDNVSIYFPITFKNNRKAVSIGSGDLIDLHN